MHKSDLKTKWWFRLLQIFYAMFIVLCILLFGAHIFLSFHKIGENHSFFTCANGDKHLFSQTDISPENIREQDKTMRIFCEHKSANLGSTLRSSHPNLYTNVSDFEIGEAYIRLHQDDGRYPITSEELFGDGLVASSTYTITLLEDEQSTSRWIILSIAEILGLLLLFILARKAFLYVLTGTT